MFVLLLKHELRGILLGPRFIVVFSICALLLLAGTMVGISEFHRGVERHDARVRASDEEILAAEHWFEVGVSAIRQPDPLSVFVSGVSFDLSEVARVGMFGSATPSQTVYSSDVLFAFFRFLDFSFVFQMVVSLLAILFTYDRISGERASGTLRLVVSNAVPRVTLVTAKVAGAWIGLTVPLLLVTGLCVLVAISSGVPIAMSSAVRLGGIVIASVVFLSCFLAIGLLVSSTTREPSTSFLVLLVIWACFALILPRMATEIAGQVVKPMTIAELEAEQHRFFLARFKVDRAKYDEIHKEWREATAGMSAEQVHEYSERTRAKMAEKYEAIQTESINAINENKEKLTEHRRAGVRNRQRLALALSRVSPVGSYRIAMMRLAGTGLESKDKFDDEVRDFGIAFQQMRVAKGTIIMSGQEEEKPDISEIPRFQQVGVRADDAIASAMPDIGLLVLYTLVALAAAFVAFLRYDVR